MKNSTSTQELVKHANSWLTLRVNAEELAFIRLRFRKTTFRKMSEYMRSMLLGKPVCITYRDRAMDEVLEELVLLRKELSAVGNNLNQAVRQVNSHADKTDSRLWSNLLSVITARLEPAICKINEGMENYAKLWSRKSDRGKA